MYELTPQRFLTTKGTKITKNGDSLLFFNHGIVGTFSNRLFFCIFRLILLTFGIFP